MGLTTLAAAAEPAIPNGLAVNNLPGPLKEALRDALCSAFDKHGLVELLTFHFPRNLSEEVNLGATEKALALEIVELCEQEGWTLRLVQMALRKKPDNPNLQAIAKLRQFHDMPWSRGVEDARETLRILPGLIDDPVVRSAIIGYRTDFEAASEQLQLVAVFKEWHNCLHVIQVKLYDRIARESQGFPGDERACEALREHFEDLQDLATPLAQYLTFTNLTSEIEWIQNLGRVVEQLNDALTQRDKALLNQTLLRLKRILAVQPSDVNRLLTAAAAAVRLNGLGDAMRRICDRLAEQHVDADTLEVFHNGRRGLDETRQKLEELVREHNQWQKVDRDLQQMDQAVQRLASQSEQSLLEIELIWRDRKPTIDKLCTCADDHLKTLCDASDNLDKALAAAEVGAIARLFHEFVRLARKRFFEVDGTLRKLSQDLLVFGQPVNAILGVIAND
jgi:hypothetical protein